MGGFCIHRATSHLEISGLTWKIAFSLEARTSFSQPRIYLFHANHSLFLALLSLYIF